jgi:hypothetical protein
VKKKQSQAMYTKNMKRNSDKKALDGVTKLKNIKVKDLSYKMVFIASSVYLADSIFGFKTDNNNQ